MDWNDYLFNFGLTLGHFDLKSNNLIVNKNKLLQNRLLTLISLICAIKMTIIVLNFWISNLKLYLMDIYIFNEIDQRTLDIGIAIFQIGFYFSYSDWTRMGKNGKLFKILRFFFISDYEELCEFYEVHYNLDEKSTVLFLKKSTFYRSFICPFLIVYNLFFIAIVSRCYYNSYDEVNLIYFLTIGLFLNVITIINYLNWAIFLSTMFVLLYLSVQFMKLRLIKIEKMIFNNFKNKSTKNLSNLEQIENKDQILKTLNEFVYQFEDINHLFDSTLSKNVLGLYIGFFAFPYFLIFLDNPIQIKTFIGFLTFVTFLFCASISLQNDILKRQVFLNFYDRTFI